MLKILCIFIFTVDIKGLYTQSHLFIYIPVNITFFQLLHKIYTVLLRSYILWSHSLPALPADVLCIWYVCQKSTKQFLCPVYQPQKRRLSSYVQREKYSFYTSAVLSFWYHNILYGYNFQSRTTYLLFSRVLSLLLTFNRLSRSLTYSITLAIPSSTDLSDAFG